MTPDSLSWTSVEGAMLYDVVRGDLDTLNDTAGDFSVATEACVADDVSGTLVDLTEIPPAGTGYWYLVRGQNCDGNGTYDSGGASQVGSRDAEIAGSGNDCP